MVEEKTVYELAYHLVPTLGEDDRAARVDALRKTIEDAGGLILNEAYPEHLELEYTMTKQIAGKLKRFDSVYFGWIYFELPADTVAEIKQVCDKDDTLVRFMIVTTTKELALTQTRPALKKESTESVAAPQPPVVAEEVAPAPASEDSDEPKEEMSEEEVDKAIDELVDEPVQA